MRLNGLGDVASESRGVSAGRSFFQQRTGRQLGLGLAFGAAVLLSGCATGPLAGPATSSVEGMSGLVHGGQQPVTGATIQLYATTATGYGSKPTLLGTTTTTSTGSFAFSNGTAATCPSGQQAYITASGGNPGLGGTVNNPAILLAAALGPCSSISSSTSVDVDEVTTVAAAYALSGFAPAGGAGLVASTGAAMTAGFGTSSTNAQGLVDAFANANNIVNYTTGQAYTATPALGSTGVVPQATINSLADILQDCVNSSSASSTACTNLFAGAKPPSTSGISAPVNTLQAALDIAQYPGNNATALFGLISANAAFSPTLTAAPNDWTIGISYQPTDLVLGLGMTIDATDNVWVLGSTSASVIQLSPLGVELSPNTANAQGQSGWLPAYTTAAQKATTTPVLPATIAQNFRNAAFDQSGNLWLSNGGAANLIEYTPAGTATSPSQGTTTVQSYATTDANLSANNYNVGVDASGNIWTSSYKKSTCASGTGLLCALVEYPKSTSYTAVDRFNGNIEMQASLGGSRAVAVNAGSTSSGDIWTTDINANNVQIFHSSSSTLTATTPAASTATALTYGVAIDAGGNGWVTGNGNNTLYQMTSAGGTTLTISPAASAPTALNAPTNPVFDGNGNLFIPNSAATANTFAEYSLAQAAYLSPNAGFAPGATFSTTTDVVSGGVVNTPSYLSIDRAGALWILSGGSTSKTTPLPSNIVQILGVAAPTNPVLAAGQYGVKP